MITHVNPLGSMDLLSQLEVDMLKRTASSDLYRLFRNCSLAVLNSGSQTDNSKELLSKHQDFDISVLRRERGVKLELVNPPEDAFVDGKIIRSLQPIFSLSCAIFCLFTHKLPAPRKHII
ncbi:hypothetical protein LY16_01665 [Xenorhabdus doucetiae]|uniref:Pyrimidine/purine nucleotide 5'-monophosphate nucleosidase N-terminal domain-containing protein n=1 Tax=Xenorhabdus doucetiae TaxID=351671 RepID=A0ABY3NTD1_9GAMM|nr:hypothetical protein LY16_01665 [Xenorhabdus doucetiae]